MPGGPSYEQWARWMQVPRPHQRVVLDQWLASLPQAAIPEAWNAQFGPGSLFDAWTATSLLRGLYASNAQLIQKELKRAGSGLRVIEIGGGDGRLWREVKSFEGLDLLVIDPIDEVGERVSDAAPWANVRHCAAMVQDTLDRPELWAGADVVICSLTLHHVAGADADERRVHGLLGPGKLEILQRFREALTPGGLLILNEADIHCDLQVPSGPRLAERLMDSYVRRCAGVLLRDADAMLEPDADLGARWRQIVRHWCLEQVALADVAVCDRDVYELDVCRWERLGERAGFFPEAVRCTDDAGLFYQYAWRVPS